MNTSELKVVVYLLLINTTIRPVIKPVRVRDLFSKILLNTYKKTKITALKIRFVANYYLDVHSVYI